MLPPDELAQAVHDYAHALLTLSGNSQRLIKQITGLVLGGAVDESTASRALRDSAVGHPDFAEGRRAFLEKRRPRFE